MMNLIILWWRPFVEILLFSSIFYYSLLSLKGTRAYQVLKGMAILLLIFALAKFLQLTIITFILSKIFGVAIVAFVILFQPEIRRFFAALGKAHLGYHGISRENTASVLMETISVLKEKYIGALIVITRQSSLRPYIDTGVSLDSKISVELLVTIFMNRTPLHDGAVIIDGDRIVAASCLLPLTQRSSFSRSLGTRHRAAIGLTEETDALVIIVSEETGKASISSAGKISLDVDMKTIKTFLIDIYHFEEAKNKNLLKNMFRKLFSTGNKK